MSVFKSKCLYPQFIRASYGEGTKMVKCNQCDHCKRQQSRRWMGKAMLESRHPVNIDQVDTDRIHKFDLTYDETPMTTPRPHRLGEVIVDGKAKPFAGPFENNRFPNQRIMRPGQEWVSMDGEIIRVKQPIWKHSGEPLTPKELAWEHRLLLMVRYGWTTEKVKQWEEGSYDPLMTTCVKDLQMFWDRVRIWHKRHRSAEAPLRYLMATEYGGVTARPHAHLVVWGLHPKDSTIIHDYWEEYQRGAATNGHVFPYRRDCILDNASKVQGGAEPYSVKDVAKMRHLTTGNPQVYEQETPRVISSQQPPIGEGAYPWWMENHISKGLHRAKRKMDATGGELEVLLCLALRQLYTHVTVPLPRDKKGRPRSETYPTTQRWQENCRQQLEVPDDVWEESSRRMEEQNVHESNLIRENVGGLGDAHKEYLDELRKRRDEIQERQNKRTQEKRAKLIADGKLRSTG